MNKALLLILTVLFFCSCEKDADPQTNVLDTSYFPLQVGNYWEYVPVLHHENLHSINVQIPSTATIAGDEYYLMITSYVYAENTQVVDSGYYRVDSRGYVFQRTTVDLNVEELNRFRLAAADGETWTIHTPPLKDFLVTTSDVNSLSINAIALENCKSYYFDFPPTIDDEHALILAPGLGIVKRLFTGGFDSILKKAEIDGTVYNF